MARKGFLASLLLWENLWRVCWFLAFWEGILYLFMQHWLNWKSLISPLYNSLILQSFSTKKMNLNEIFSWKPHTLETLNELWTISVRFVMLFKTLLMCLRLYSTFIWSPNYGVIMSGHPVLPAVGTFLNILLLFHSHSDRSAVSLLKIFSTVASWANSSVTS